MEPAAQAVFVEAITRLREYLELNQRANKFYEEVLPRLKGFRSQLARWRCLLSYWKKH